MERKLGRKKSNREHMIRNLATSLLLYEAIETTEAKAKMVKSFVEKIIARNKKADLNARRSAAGVLFDNNAVKKLFAEILPRYENRNSGFIRSFHLKERNGDNAKMMRLELIDKLTFVEKAEVKEVTSKKETPKTSEKKEKATKTTKVDKKAEKQDETK